MPLGSWAQGLAVRTQRLRSLSAVSRAVDKGTTVSQTEHGLQAEENPQDRALLAKSDSGLAARSFGFVSKHITIQGSLSNECDTNAHDARRILSICASIGGGLWALHPARRRSKAWYTTPVLLTRSTCGTAQFARLRPPSRSQRRSCFQWPCTWALPS